MSDTVIPLIGYTRNKREPERVLVDYTSNDRHSLWKQNVRAFTYEVRGPGRSIRVCAATGGSTDHESIG